MRRNWTVGHSQKYERHLRKANFKLEKPSTEVATTTLAILSPPVTLNFGPQP